MDTVNRLDIETRAGPRAAADPPTVRILVDGAEVLRRIGSMELVAFPGTDLLGARSPLIPQDPAQRVALYHCGCGEPGCGVAAPLITRHGERITWSDFRDFVGVFHEPVFDGDVGGGTPLRLPELTFDACQYLAEVERASEDLG